MNHVESADATDFFNSLIAALPKSRECGSIAEVAAAKKVDQSCLCRVLWPTVLAPDTVEANYRSENC